MVTSIPAGDVSPPSAAGSVVVERCLDVSVLSAVSQALSAGASERIYDLTDQMIAAAALVVIQV